MSEDWRVIITALLPAGALLISQWLNGRSASEIKEKELEAASQQRYLEVEYGRRADAYRTYLVEAAQETRTLEGFAKEETAIQEYVVDHGRLPPLFRAPSTGYADAYEAALLVASADVDTPLRSVHTAVQRLRLALWLGTIAEDASLATHLGTRFDNARDELIEAMRDDLIQPRDLRRKDRA